MYTTHSKESLDYFKENSDSFVDYHDGFKNQVKKWPKNPVDIFITELKKPKYNGMVIADLGCGEGKLELEIKKHDETRVVHSYDIGKIAPHVHQVDIANLPLEKESLDVAVFSLSLMSTNFLDMLIEANNKLKEGGLLFVAEVSSRLDIKKFVMHLGLMGFVKRKVGQIETYFYIMIFEKQKGVSRKQAKKLAKRVDPSEYLTPCRYKKR